MPKVELSVNPFLKGDKLMIYFDNAATTGKKPAEVINAVVTALKGYSANPGRGGYKYSAKTADAVFRVREKTAEFFGAEGPEKVVFTLNCTHSINAVLKGVLKKGDHIVVSSLEHNAVMRPLKKAGTSYTVAEVSLTDDETTVENFKRAIRPNTKMIFCTGGSNVLGRLLPIERIGELCKEKKLLFGVDAAQIAGVIPIDMKKMNIDYLCVAAHKGLYAPMGLGILICRKSIPETIIEGGTGTNSLDLTQPSELPERLESGTVNVPAIIGLGAGLDFIEKRGIKRLYSEEMKLIKAIYNGLAKNRNIELYTPLPEPWSYAPLLSFNFKGIESNAVARLLDQNNIAVRAGYHCAPSAHKQIGTLENGAVRVSVSAFNTFAEADTFIKTVNDENFFKILKKSIE